MNCEHLNMGAYNLHVIKTNKFKTITVEINFRREVKKEEITKRNLLKGVLLNSTANFPTERELIIETEKLYDLKLISSNSRVGNYTNLSYKTRFLNEKYTEPGMNQESIKLLLDILFRPNVKNNAFKEEILNNIKMQLEKGILSLKDNKVRYSLNKLLESTESYPYSYNYYGYLEDLNYITPENLYQYYQEVLNNDLIDIFVVGDVDIPQIKEILKDYFNNRTFRKDLKNIVVKENPVSKVKRLKELDCVNQTQLTMLYSISNLTEYERKYVLLVFNELLGGSSNSLLFENVREKNSYAYYINSIIKAYDNILMIYSGIESGKEKEVEKIVNDTINKVTRGQVNTKVLDNAKETIRSSIKVSLDSPTGIINTNYARILVNSDDFQTRIEKIDKVSKEDIINISKKIKLNTIFTLESEGEDEENSDRED